MARDGNKGAAGSLDAAQRRAAALRANLKRRKVQLRAIGGSEDGPATRSAPLGRGEAAAAPGLAAQGEDDGKSGGS